MWPEIEFNTTFQLQCPYGMSTNAVREQVEGGPITAKKTINKDNLERGQGDGRIQHRLSRSGKPFAERSCVLVNESAMWAPVRDHNCREEVGLYICCFSGSEKIYDNA